MLFCQLQRSAVKEILKGERCCRKEGRGGRETGQKEKRKRDYAHSVEPVVDEMLQVFAHADLSHQLVLVAVHACQLTHVGKDVLHSISKLKQT